MDIKLFSLCKQEVDESEKGKKYILDCVHSFFPEAEGFAPFTSQKRMLLAISQSLRAADVVIIAVQGNMYNATKRLLCAALGIKLKTNGKVAEKLNVKLETGKIKQATYDANVKFPIGAEIFPTDSGLNNGFALTAGGQHLIYLPIETPRADETVFGSLYDYLKELCDDSTNDAALKKRHVEIIERTLKKLEINSIKLAINSEIMPEYIPSRIFNRKLRSTVVFDNDIPENEQPTPNEYYMHRARYIRDIHRTQYGLSISKPFVDDNTQAEFIIAAIADEAGTNTIKIFAEENEDTKSLYANTVDKLMLMLYDYGEYMNLSDDDSVSTDADKLIRKAIAKITASAIAASAVIGIIASIMLK